ncbi:MAG TPA: signal peptidase I, partial [Planctomycetota bacterium]|nr:signal peptidase I [Planctomycetota bacterium]
ARWVEADGAGPRRLYARPGGFDGSAASPGPASGAAAAGPRPAESRVLLEGSPLAAVAAVDLAVGEPPVYPIVAAGLAGLGAALSTAPRLLRAAEAASRSVPDPFAREESRAEILSHLAAAAGAREAAGAARDEAERAAVRALGDPWRVRSDFRRVHRGRASRAFPRTALERSLAVLFQDVIPLVVVLGLLLLVRWQVLQPYNIPTKSMEPTLHGDGEDPDFILVDKTAFLRRDIERWEVAVFLPPGHPEHHATPVERPDGPRQPFVKRCVGLGGESLDIRGGDAWVDGALARRTLEVEDAMMVPLYDLGDDLRRAAERARFGRLGFQVFGMTWGAVEGDEAPGWSLRGESFAAVPSGGSAARLAFRDRLVNSFVDANGRREVPPHVDNAGDLEVRLLVEASAPGTVAGADLLEGETRHEFRAGPRGIEVRSGGRTWTSPHGALRPGRPVELRFRNVDDRLTVRVDGEVVLREELPARVSIPTDPERGGVELVVEGGPARVGGIRILRDIVYLRTDDKWPVHIPPGRLFMMGDNTGSSNDSRAWGPVLAEDLIGRPFVVVWPPSRLRSVR